MFAGRFDLSERQLAPAGNELLALFTLDNRLLLVLHRNRLTGRIGQGGHQLTALLEHHFDLAADQFAVLAQHSQRLPDSGRSDRQFEILLLAVERRLDRPAQRDATVDAHLRIAVDDHFDPVPRRNAYVDHKEVGTVHLRLGDFAYPYSVNHTRFGFI